MLSTNLNKNANLCPHTFIVVSGPNNLIGRHSLARLWPEEFNKFKAVATSNYNLGSAKDDNKCDINVINKAQISNVSVKTDKIVKFGNVVKPDKIDKSDNPVKSNKVKSDQKVKVANDTKTISKPKKSKKSPQTGD